MAPIIVHGVPGSPYMRMPLLACLEKGAPYQIAAMQFGQNKTPEHLARHPFGRIPVVEHDGFWLYEAQAIIRYIDQAFPGPSLTPADPKAQARMNQVMGIVDWYVMPSVSAGIGWNRVVAPMVGAPVDEAAVAKAVPAATTRVRARTIVGQAEVHGGDSISPRRHGDSALNFPATGRRRL
jgi:glutathione S-transferase